MCGEFKKAVMTYFKLISRAEKNHDSLNRACVLIEVRFRKVYMWLPKESDRLQ
jgi:hypothetical protein